MESTLFPWGIFMIGDQKIFSQSEKEKEREIFDLLFGKVSWMGG